jgi:F-type H+-transporting ATPase subunit delta
LQQDLRVARRYATALFEAAKHGGNVMDVEGDLGSIVEALKADAGFRDFLYSPYTSREDKAAILERVLGGRIQPVTMQLIKIVLEKRREAEIAPLYGEYVILRRAHESVAYAVITTAEPLDSTQQASVVSRLEGLLRKRIEPSFEVDPSIMGGIRVKYENFIMDGSVRGSLTRLKESLKHDVLKQA